MPIYEYHCNTCQSKQEVFARMGNAPTQVNCDCGEMAHRVFSAPTGIHLPTTGKSKLINALNKEGGCDLPTRPENRKQMEKAVARGLKADKRVVGFGF